MVIPLKTHVPLALTEAEAFSFLFYQQRAYAAGAGFVGKATVHDVGVGVTGPRAPAFLPVDDDAIAVDARVGGQIGQGRTGIRLRHGHRDHHFSGAHLRDDAPAQALVGEVGDGQRRAEARLENREGHARRDLRHLLEHQHRVEMRHAHAAVGGVEIDAEQPKLCIALDDVGRERLIVVLHLPGGIDELLRREAAHRVLQELLFVGQREIHRLSLCSGMN